MTTFAAAVANGDQSWCVLVRIEGVGDNVGGQWTFCSQLPDYASTDSYKPWLVDWPELVSEQANVAGGLAEAGGVDFEILDVDDQLTALLGMDDDAVAVLAADITGATSTISFVNGAAIAEEALIFIGNECLYVSTKPTTNTATVVRGVLGTDYRGHAQGSAVALSLPYLRSRRVQVYLAPKDGDSADEKVLFGQFSLDRLTMREDMNAYKVSAKSEIKYLSRVVPRAPKNWTLSPTSPDSFFLEPLGILPFLDWGGDPAAYLLLGGQEVLIVESASIVKLDWRQQLNTAKTKLDQGTTATLIYAADNVSNDTPDGAASFRWNPGPDFGGSISTDRASGTWTPTSHPIDLLLILLTSSYDDADGLELTNYDADKGNWSSLPSGYGAGLPITSLDLDSFLDVRGRYPHWSVPNFYFGQESRPIADLILEAILRPFGCFLCANNGQMLLVRPRPPIQGIAPAATITLSANVLRTAGPPALAKVAPTYAGDSQISTCVYKTRGRDGVEISTVVTNGDLPGTGAQPGYYAHDEGAIEIAFAARADGDDGFSQLAYELAEARLYLNQRPAFRVVIEVDLSLYMLKPGDLVNLTIPELPDFRRKARDWTNRGAILLERAVQVDPDGGARMLLGLLAYADARMGIVAPAAVVTSVSTNTATVAANRYTDANNPFGLPTSDAAAFAVGDQLRLYNLDLSLADAGTQAVVAIGANTLELDGDFGGALASGLILRYAARGPASDEVTATQAASFVFLASTETMQIGTTGDATWRWALP